eukprot:6176215-Pleurochrysis_carterae.AAC.1
MVVVVMVIAAAAVVVLVMVVAVVAVAVAGDERRVLVVAVVLFCYRCSMVSTLLLMLSVGASIKGRAAKLVMEMMFAEIASHGDERLNGEYVTSDAGDCSYCY